MASRDTTPLGYRRIVILLVSLVVVPSSLLLTSGVVLIFLGEARLNLLMGILVMALSGAAVTGVVLVWVFVRREANLSELQADFEGDVDTGHFGRFQSQFVPDELLEPLRGRRQFILAGAEEQHGIAAGIIGSGGSYFVRRHIRRLNFDVWNRRSARVKDVTRDSGTELLCINDGTQEQKEQQAYILFQRGISPSLFGIFAVSLTP